MVRMFASAGEIELAVPGLAAGLLTSKRRNPRGGNVIASLAQPFVAELVLNREIWWTSLDDGSIHWCASLYKEVGPEGHV